MTSVTYHAIEAFRASRGLAPSLRIILGRAAAAALLMDGGPCRARDDILAAVGDLEALAAMPADEAGHCERCDEFPIRGFWVGGHRFCAACAAVEATHA